MQTCYAVPSSLSSALYTRAQSRQPSMNRFSVDAYVRIAGRDRAGLERLLQSPAVPH